MLEITCGTVAAFVVRCGRNHADPNQGVYIMAFNQKPAVWHNIKSFQVSEGGSIRLTIGQTRSGQPITVMFPMQYFSGLLDALQDVTQADLDNALKIKEQVKAKEHIAKSLEKVQTQASKNIQAAIDAFVASGMSQDEAKKLVLSKLVA